MAIMPPIQLSAQANAAGTATIDYSDPSHDYIIEQISVSTNGVLQGVCTVKRNSFFIMGSAQAISDTADGEPPILLSAGEHLVLTFTAVDPGCQCYAYMAGEQSL